MTAMTMTMTTTFYLFVKLHPRAVVVNSCEQVLPMLAIEAKLPYFGVTPTQAHCEALRSQLEKLTFAAMRTSSELLEPSLVAAYKKVCVTEDVAKKADSGGGKKNDDQDGDKTEAGKSHKRNLRKVNKKAAKAARGKKKRRTGDNVDDDVDADEDQDQEDDNDDEEGDVEGEDEEE
jgi:hypothetical protein